VSDSENDLNLPLKIVHFIKESFTTLYSEAYTNKYFTEIFNYFKLEHLSLFATCLIFVGKAGNFSEWSYYQCLAGVEMSHWLIIINK
jgi:hypothetical protein